MIIAGISIESKSLIIALMDSSTMGLIESTTKIELDNDEIQENIKSFYQTISVLIRDHNIKSIFIKKRARKGDHASGPLSFKIEGIIQMLDVPVNFISPITISSYLKKSEIELPKKLFKYQHDAYKTVYVSIRKYINV